MMAKWKHQGKTQFAKEHTLESEFKLGLFSRRNTKQVWCNQKTVFGDKNHIPAVKGRNIIPWSCSTAAGTDHLTVTETITNCFFFCTRGCLKKILYNLSENWNWSRLDYTTWQWFKTFRWIHQRMAQKKKDESHRIKVKDRAINLLRCCEWFETSCMQDTLHSWKNSAWRSELNIDSDRKCLIEVISGKGSIPAIRA